jgi:hypothetical protein
MRSGNIFVSSKKNSLVEHFFSEQLRPDISALSGCTQRFEVNPLNDILL